MTRMHPDLLDPQAADDFVVADARVREEPDDDDEDEEGDDEEDEDDGNSDGYSE